jgi:hypothetical protein
MSDFFSMVQKLHEIERNEAHVERKPLAEQANPATDGRPAEVVATANILRELDAIEVTPKSVAEVKADDIFEAKKDEVEVDVEETMQNRFAKFMKAERAAGSDIDVMKSMIDEGTAEYEYADRAFTKMSETMDMLNSMVAEGGMLGRKINEAGGDATALEEVAQALDVAREALTRAHSDALGIALEQTED